MSPIGTTDLHLPRQAQGGSEMSSVRLKLCTVDESDAVRRRHVAALLAFTPTVSREANRVWFAFEERRTALWVSQALACSDVELVEAGGGGGAVAVSNSQVVLASLGFRDGRWIFGQGMDAALGISRGAVHAAGSFHRRGLKVQCPSAPMMLTLAAVMARLSIAARPTEMGSRVVVRAGDVAAALERLGVAGSGDEHHKLLEDEAPQGSSS